MKTADEILHEHGIAPPPPGKHRYYTTCPQCSANRSRAHQKAACLGVTVKGDGVTWGCNHCLWTGGGYFNGKINGPGGEPARTYDYLDEQGKLLSQKVRNPPGSMQRFWQRRPDGKGGWINNTQGVRKVLYRLPELLEAIASDRTILVVEGEKDADSLWRIGIPATCSPDGASDIGKAAKWRMAYSESLGGADLVVIPDHDDAGYAHASATAKASVPVAKRVRLLTLAKHWPECPKGGDVSDWLAAGHTREQLDALIDRAPDHGRVGGRPRGVTWDNRHSPKLAVGGSAALPEVLTFPDNPTSGAASDVHDPAASEERGEKPRLLVDNCNPDQTVAALRDLLADARGLYDRGVPVRLAFDQNQRGTVAQLMTPDALVLMAHSICRPYVLKAGQDGTVAEVNARLPRSLAVMYLDWRGEWRLPPLNGIASAPLLQDDGTVRSAAGYDPTSGMWCENVPKLTGLVPERPTKDAAAAALCLIRETFKTFCFADAETIEPTAGGVATIDTSKTPGRDEASFLVALLTAVCRPSLHLAPGVLLRAAPVSGAGAGKGLLARCICIIAFGREPHAVTAGANAEELEKRIAAELIEGSPALFLDNLNNRAFRSDLLASAITERPARVRLLGRSQMVPLNASTFVILTGNGLTVSEDLARRFVAVDFDARTEDPEVRPFATDIRVEVTQRRTELLAALLTIWRWGRIATDIKPGIALGSFAEWCRWVRDPLLALGCQDPVERVSEAKQRDGHRQAVADLFNIWWEKHQDHPVAIRELHEDVRQALDPQGRGRQYVSSQAEKLAGTRMAGFVFTRQAPAGKWGAATYALKRTSGEEGHRDHRGHKEEQPSTDAPYASYADGNRNTGSAHKPPRLD